MEMMAPYCYYDMQCGSVSQPFTQDEDVPCVLQAKRKELSTGPLKNYITSIFIGNQHAICILQIFYGCNLVYIIF
jgi:hypothetical protein